MEQVIGYGILLFGIVGVALGLYGLFMPAVRGRIPQLRLPRKALVEDDMSRVDNLIAELERSGFRGTPFEAAAEPEAAAGPAQVAQPDVAAAVQPEPVPQPAANPIESSARAEPFPREEAARDVPMVETPHAEPVPLDIRPAEPQAEEPRSLDDRDATVPEPPAPAEPAIDQLEEEPGAKAEDDLMALFAEAAEQSSTPAALRDSIPKATIQELLAEAREIRRLLTGADDNQRPAA